jgi:hypothetical protein
LDWRLYRFIDAFHVDVKAKGLYLLLCECRILGEIESLCRLK